MSSTGTDDDSIIQTPDALVFGVMGVGTFIIGLLIALIFFIFILSSPCEGGLRITTRIISIVIFGIIILILVFADKQSTYKSGSIVEIYDYSMIPRIAVCILLSLFTICSGVSLVALVGETKELSSNDYDKTTLWLED